MQKYVDKTSFASMTSVTTSCEHWVERKWSGVGTKRCERSSERTV